jgi:NadR type nicotinamide-nucleotide adenylyltransferase
MSEVKKIVVIGPESTGKSTLCQMLAEYFDTLWCPEYAREYLSIHGSNYTYDDLLSIAKGQIALEDAYMDRCLSSAIKRDRPFLFVDTDMYVMKVWCEYVYGKCHLYILDRIVERKVDMYLLCNIDLPWVNDEFREYPDLEKRKELMCMYEDILINQNVPWAIISGNYENRLKTAITCIEKNLMIT